MESRKSADERLEGGSAYMGDKKKRPIDPYNATAGANFNAKTYPL